MKKTADTPAAAVLPRLPDVESLRGAIRRACDTTGVTPTAVGKAVAGDGKALTQFLNGGRKPSYEKMVQIVSFLKERGAPMEGVICHDCVATPSSDGPQGNKVSEVAS